MSEVTLFFVAQSIIIVGAILTAYVRTAIAIAVLKSNTEGLKVDHARLTKKVDGVSRAVAQIEGSLSK